MSDINGNFYTKLNKLCIQVGKNSNRITNFEDSYDTIRTFQNMILEDVPGILGPTGTTNATEFYDEFTYTSSFATAPINGGTLNAKLVKTGNVVTGEITSDVTGAATSSASFLTASGIPERFRPETSYKSVIKILNNSVETTGLLQIPGRNNFFSGNFFISQLDESNFDNAGNAGFYIKSFSYTLFD